MPRPAPGRRLARLHLEAAQAWHDLGDPERALRSANEGLAVCPDDPLTRAGLLRQRFVQVFNLEHRSPREDLYEAIELLEGVDDARARVLLSRVLSNLAIGERGDDAAEHAARAIALAEEAGDDAALAVALTVEAWRIADDEDDVASAMAPIERACRSALDPSVRVYAGAAQVDLLARLGRFDEAVVVGSSYDEDRPRGHRAGLGLVDRLLGRAGAVRHRAPREALRYARRARRLAEPGLPWSAPRCASSRRTSAGTTSPRARDELLVAERAAIDESLRATPDKHGSWAIDRATPPDPTCAGATACRPADGAMGRHRRASRRAPRRSAVTPR